MSYKNLSNGTFKKLLLLRNKELGIKKDTLFYTLNFS